MSNKAKEIKDKRILYKQQFEIEGKTVSVYPASAEGSAIIYLNTFAEEGDSVYRALQGLGCPDFSLVAISGLDWNHDMAPWDIPPISKGDTPCTGGADEYLRLLTDRILPKAEEYIPGDISWRGLAGYSLAGLFAVYSLCHTELFEGAASVSGSLWFPGLKEYIFSHEIKSSVKHLYFSLGDRECRTKNPYLKEVQKATEEIHSYYESKGLDTTFELNPGGHFDHAVERTAAGIAWLLGR